MEEVIAEGLSESHGLGRYDMFQGATLVPWENGQVHKGGHFPELPVFQGYSKGVVKILPHQYKSSPGSAKGLMGGCGHKMAMRDGIVQYALGDQTGRMCN